MFDIGWTEMLVVGVIAIIFVGPKELPGMLRTFGQVIRKVRGMAGDFQGQFNDALKEAELDGLRDTVNDMRSLDPTKAIKDKLNPLKADLEKPIEAKKKVQTPQEIEADIAENYRKAQENAKRASSGPNAVPGFGEVEVKPEAQGESAAAEAKPKAKKAAPKKAAPKKATVKKAPVKKSPAKKPTTAKKAASKKKPAKKAPVKKTVAASKSGKSAT